MSTETLPQAPDAERYIIGVGVRYPDRFHEVLATRLTVRDFVDPLHQRIFAVFIDQHARGGIDPVLAGEQTDPGYLQIREKETSTSALVPCEASKIIECRRKRQLHQITETAKHGSLNGQSADDVYRLLSADLDDFNRELQGDIELPKASSIEPRAIDWAWPGYLPRGMFTLLDGDPEKGKSQITCGMAACWSAPRPFPFAQNDHFRDPGNVLMVAAEDNADTTTVPRLIAAGANLDRVRIWPEDAEPISFPNGIDALAAAVKRYEIGLVILDPLGAYLDENINANRDADVRRALRPLVALAQETNVAVLGVRHLNKDESKSPLYRGGGSIAFTAAARVVWAAGQDPNDSTRLVLAVLKSNVGKKPPSLSYSIEGVDTTSRIRWEGESACTAGDIFTSKRHRGGKIEDAESLMLEMLANGAKPERDVRDACYAAGIKDWSYKQARKKLGIETSKGSMREGWLLSLPEEDGQCEEDGEQC